MVRRLHQTTADHLVIAISPALIMALVGSLVFFLMAVLYQGEFALRLHWVMVCFVFAAVLIGRISIEQGFERALPFGFALAMVVGLATNRFMTIQGSWVDQFSFLINWSLIGLIWWCAHRLTWDCTLIDDSQDSSGEGLLRTAGLDPEGDSAGSPAAAIVEGTTSRAPQSNWYQRYVERQRRPHAPGVWVVYFSLAALPLFGVGQWFIPSSDVGQRRWAFWLLCVYVASGLGLLLTTSFLGLRRYLRQRRIEMPTLMANVWLGMGAGMIVLLLILAALLPRPNAEIALSRLPFSVGSPEQQASQIRPTRSEGAQDEQPGAAEGQRSDERPDPAGEAPSDRATESGKQNAPSSGDSSQQPGSQPSSQVGQSAEGARTPSGQSNQETSQGSASQQQGSGAQDSSGRQQPSAQDRQANQQGEPPSNAQQQTPPQTPPSAAAPPSVPQPLSLVSETLLSVLKGIFYAVVAGGILFALWRSRHAVLAAVREWLAGLLGLLGGRRVRSVAAENPNVRFETAPVPFAHYADPFASGSSAGRSMEELVSYSFEAFEAWAREHDCPRQPDQTPHELAREVGRHADFIAAEAHNLAELYSRAAYARDLLPATGVEQLRRLWGQMSASTVPPRATAAQRD